MLCVKHGLRCTKHGSTLCTTIHGLRCVKHGSTLRTMIHGLPAQSMDCTVREAQSSDLCKTWIGLTKAWLRWCRTSPILHLFHEAPVNKVVEGRLASYDNCFFIITKQQITWRKSRDLKQPPTHS